MRRWVAITAVLLSEATATAAGAYALATPAHDQVPWTIALVLAIAGPAVAALRRRSASWLLAPLVIPVLLTVFVQVTVKPPDPAKVRADNAAAQGIAAELDAVVAYEPPALPEGPGGLPGARRAFDAALERAKPLLAARGIQLLGVRTARGGAGDVIMLDVAGHRTRVCVWYRTTDPHPEYARGGAC
jgi:hypothetical protein